MRLALPRTNISTVSSSRPFICSSAIWRVFGQVESGMEVADAIANVPTGGKGPMPDQAPVTPIIVKKVALLK